MDQGKHISRLKSLVRGLSPHEHPHSLPPDGSLDNRTPDNSTDTLATLTDQVDQFISSHSSLEARIVTNLDGLICQSDHSASILLGLSNGELNGQSITKLSAKKSKTDLTKLLRAAVKSKLPQKAQVEIRWESKPALLAQVTAVLLEGSQDNGATVLWTLAQRPPHISGEQILNQANWLQLLTTRGPDGLSIWHCDPDRTKRRLLWCNDRYAEMAGQGRERLLNAGRLDLMVKSIEEPSTDFFESMKNNQPSQGIDCWIRPDGKENYHHWTALPMQVEGELYFLGIDHDVTDRTVSERALRRKHEQMTMLMDHTSDGVSVVAIDNQDGKLKCRLTMCNDRFVEMSGFTREQLMAMEDTNQVIHTLRRDPVPLANCCHTGRARWLRPDGKENCYEYSACPIYISGKLHFVGIDRDITERVRSEIQLHEYQEQLKAVLANALDGISIDKYVNTADGSQRRLVLCNERYVEMSGYTREHLMATNLDELITHAWQNPDCKMRGDKNHAHSGVSSWVRPDGKENYFEWKTVITELQGQRCYIGVQRDITDRVKSERELKVYQEQLETILNNTSDGIHIDIHVPGTSKRRLVLCNDRYVELSGYSREQLMEMDDLDELSEIVSLATDFMELKRKGLSRHGTSSWLRPDGKENYIEWTTADAVIDGQRHTIGVDRDATERVLAERKLREHQERIDLIMRHSHDGISLSYTDLETGKHRIVTCNERYAAMSGRSRQELLDADNINDFLETIEESGNFSQMMHGSKPCTGLNSWKRPDGKENYHEWTAVPFEHDGRVHIIGINRDVTERVRTQREIRQQHNRLQMVMDNTSDGISITEVDPDTERRRLVMCNDRYAEMSGRSAEELLASEDLNKFVKVTQRNSSGSPEHYHSGLATWIRPDGKENYFEWTACLHMTDGKMQFIGVDRDTTQRVLAERELRKSHDQLLSIIDFLPDATFVVNKKGQVIAWNLAMEAMTGTGKEDILHKEKGTYSRLLLGNTDNALIDLVLTNDPQTWASIESRCDYLHTAGNTIVAEWPAVMPGSTEEHYYWATASALRDDEGALVGAIQSIRDITDRRRAEQSLKQAEVAERHHRQQLQSLTNINIRLSNAKSSKDLCRMAISLGHSQLGFDRLSIWFTDPEDPNQLIG